MSQVRRLSPENNIPIQRHNLRWLRNQMWTGFTTTTRYTYLMKNKYVDGFLLVIPKDKVAEYKNMAELGR